MPIREYVCADCRTEFEELVRGDEAVACPRCSGRRAERKLSTFATARASDRAPSSFAPAGGCGTCGDPRGPGSCAS